MEPSVSERLTKQFYDWEIRGRGWTVFDAALTPEPPYIPFWGHYLPSTPVPVDDGRVHTLGSRVADRFRSLFNAKPAAPQPREPDEDRYTLEERDNPAHLSIVLPKAVTYSKDICEQFLLNLSQCRHPLCLEFVGYEGSVTMGLATDPSDATLASNLLQSHYPEAVVCAAVDQLRDHWAEGVDWLAVDWALSNEFMLPLRFYRSFAPDPLIGLISALGSLQADELACVQVLFTPVRHPWAEGVMRAVLGSDGRDFFSNAPDFVRETSSKLQSPLFGVILRGIAQSPERGRCRDILRGLTGSLAVMDSLQGNQLIPLNNDGYDDDDHLADVMARQSRRSGMILCLDELMTFVHLPGSTVTTPAFVRSVIKTKAAPDTVARGELILGENTHAGKTATVRLPLEARLRHSYIIGASGSGKTTLLASMMKQDIDSGRGFGILDPHGDLIDQVLTYIPESRAEDVVLLDLADEEFPVPFNMLSAHSDLDKNLLASDLAAVFKRLATSWGDQMTAVLSNAILAFLESDRGGTLADLRRFLVERPFREAFLPTVKDSEIVYYWTKEFPQLSGKPQVSVVSRLNTFLRPKPIRYMVNHGENRLDFTKIMDSQKIFLARIPQGAIGEENAFLLGTLLVSAFHRAALTRQQLEADRREPFFLYIDEFHEFVTPSMASILSGARKYGLGLVLAHQEYRQLESRDQNVAASVWNATTRVCFRLGDQDARKFESGFSSFDASDLQNLGIGDAICRVERAQYDFNLHVTMLPKIDPKVAAAREAAIRDVSRRRYSVPRAQVEAKMAEARAADSQEDEEPTDSSDRGKTSRKREQPPRAQPADKSASEVKRPPADTSASDAKAAPAGKIDSDVKAEPIGKSASDATAEAPGQMTSNVKTEPTVGPVPEAAPSTDSANQAAPLIEASKQEAEPADVATPDSETQPDVVPVVTPSPVATPKPESTPGRGGPKHKAIQFRIKQQAEGMGYGAQIESSILEGRASVDVALRKGDVSIACQVSVTTPTDYECANLEKCLSAGFTHVVMVCDDEDRLKAIREKFQKTLEGNAYSHVHFMVPQDLLRLMEEIEKTAGGADTVRGYKVKFTQSKSNGSEASERAKSVKRTIADAAARRKKRKKDNDQEE